MQQGRCETKAPASTRLRLWGERMKFLVNGIYGENCEEFSRIMTENEIFGMMDMEDCVPGGIGIDVWKIGGFGDVPVEMSFHGKWHDVKDPLKMVIVGGGERVVGYGTEH